MIVEDKIHPDEILNVVFTYNRPDYLRNIVRSHCDCAPGFRLLIVDDASTEPAQISGLIEFGNLPGVEVIAAVGGAQRHGGLYRNMNDALSLAAERGYRFLNLLQDDMQFVRPAATDLLRACSTLDSVHNGLHISLGFRKYLDVRNEPKTCDVPDVYRSQNLQVSDTGILHVERATKAGFTFQNSEREHNELALNLGFAGYVFRNPLVAFVPWPVYFRNRKQGGSGFGMRRTKLVPIQMMSEVDIQRLRDRSIEDLPYMEDWCLPASGYWLKPYNYTSSKSEWARRILTSFKQGVKFKRCRPGIALPKRAMDCA